MAGRSNPRHKGMVPQGACLIMLLAAPYRRVRLTSNVGRPFAVEWPSTF